MKPIIYFALTAAILGVGFPVASADKQDARSPNLNCVTSRLPKTGFQKSTAALTPTCKPNDQLTGGGIVLKDADEEVYRRWRILKNAPNALDNKRPNSWICKVGAVNNGKRPEFACYAVCCHAGTRGRDDEDAPRK